LVGLALALLLLLVFYKFFYPELSREAQLAMIDPGVLQQSNIDALQAEIDAYRAALDGDVCLAPPLADAAPLFRPRALALPEGGAAGDDGTDGGGGGAPPPNLPPPLNPDAGDNIESATVLVIASGDESAGAGTGFFINDRQLLTNRHVVADALGSRNGVVLITSKSLGRVVRVEIKSVTPANEVGRDYAVLEVSEPVNHAKLALQPQAQRQERVGAWGYPSLNTEMDPQMQALLEGDATSAPEIIYSEGVISVVQRGTGGPSIISHTADVSHGNSGGPLVNAAGDVIGINTQIRADEKSNRQVNMSLASDDIIRFLGENGISYDLARNPA
jgi:V8-like Glu-specific endopeptidase